MNLRPADYEDLGEDFFRAASGRKVTDFSGGAGHHSRNRTYAEPSGEWFPSLLAVSRRSVTGFRNRTPNLCRSPNLSYRRVVGFDGSVAGFWGGPLWNSEKIYGQSICQVRRERGPMGGEISNAPVALDDSTPILLLRGLATQELRRVRQVRRVVWHKVPDGVGGK